MKHSKLRLSFRGYAGQSIGPKPWIVLAGVCGVLFLGSLPLLGYLWRWTHPVEAVRSHPRTAAASRFEAALHESDGMTLVQSSSPEEQWVLVSPNNSDEQWLYEVSGLSRRLCRALATAPSTTDGKCLLARIVNHELVSAEYVGVWYPVSTFGNAVRSPSGSIFVFEGGGIVRGPSPPTQPDN